MNSKGKITGRPVALGIAVVLAAAMFAGCQSTGVVPMDQDSYFIGKEDGSAGIGVSLDNKAAAVYRESSDFCHNTTTRDLRT